MMEEEDSDVCGDPVMAKMLKHLQTMEATGSQSKEVWKYSIMIDSLLETNIKLKTRNNELQERNKELLERNEELQAENEQLKESQGKCRIAESSPVEGEAQDKSEAEESKGIESTVVPCTLSAVEESDVCPAELCEAGTQLQEGLPHEDINGGDGAIQAVPGSPPEEPLQAQVGKDVAISGEEPEGDTVHNEPTKVDNEPTNMDKQPTKVDKQPMGEEQKGDKVHNQPTKVDKQPTNVDNQPTKVDKQPTKVDKQPMGEVQEGDKVHNQPTNMDNQPTKVDKQPMMDSCSKNHDCNVDGQSSEMPHNSQVNESNDTNSQDNTVLTTDSSTCDSIEATKTERSAFQVVYDMMRELSMQAVSGMLQGPSRLSDNKRLAVDDSGETGNSPKHVEDEGVVVNMTASMSATQDSCSKSDEMENDTNGCRRSRSSSRDRNTESSALLQEEAAVQEQRPEELEPSPISNHQPVVDLTQSGCHSTPELSDGTALCSPGKVADLTEENKSDHVPKPQRFNRRRKKTRRRGRKPVVKEMSITNGSMSSKEVIQYLQTYRAEEKTTFRADCSGESPTEERGGSPLGIIDTESALRAVMVISDSCVVGGTTDSQAENKGTDSVEELVQKAATSVVIDSHEERQHSEQEDVRTNVCLSPMTPQKHHSLGRPPGKRPPKGRSLGVSTDFGDTCGLDQNPEVCDTDIEILAVIPQKRRGRGRPPGKTTPKGRSQGVSTDSSDTCGLKQNLEVYDADIEISAVTPHPGEDLVHTAATSVVIGSQEERQHSVQDDVRTNVCQASDDTHMEISVSPITPQKRRGRGRPPGKRTPGKMPPKGRSQGVSTDFGDTCGLVPNVEVYHTVVTPQKRRGRPPGKKAKGRSLHLKNNESSSIPKINSDDTDLDTEPVSVTPQKRRRGRPPGKRTLPKENIITSSRLRPTSREKLTESRILLFNSDDDELDVAEDTASSALGGNSQNSAPWMSQEVPAVTQPVSYSAALQLDVTSAASHCHVQDNKEARPEESAGMYHSHSNAIQEVIVSNVTQGTVQSVDSEIETIDIEHEELRTKIPSDSTGETSPKPNGDQVLHKRPEELSSFVVKGLSPTTTSDQEVLRKFPDVLEKSPVVLIKRLEMTSTTTYICKTELSGRHQDSCNSVQKPLDPEVKTTSPSMQELAQGPLPSCPTPESSDELDSESRICGMTRAWTKAEVIRQVREHSLKETSSLHDGKCPYEERASYKEVHQETRCHIDLESALTAVTIIQKSPRPPGGNSRDECTSKNTQRHIAEHNKKLNTLHEENHLPYCFAEDSPSKTLASKDAERREKVVENPVEKEVENHENLVGMVPGSLKIRVRLSKSKVDGKIKAKCVDTAESGGDRKRSRQSSGQKPHVKRKMHDETNEVQNSKELHSEDGWTRKHILFGKVQQADENASVSKVSSCSLHAQKQKLDCTEDISRDKAANTKRMRKGSEESSEYSEDVMKTTNLREAKTSILGKSKAQVSSTNRSGKKLKVHFEGIPQTTADTSKQCQKPSTAVTNVKGPDSSKEENRKTLDHAPPHSSVENKRKKDFGAALMQADCAVDKPARQVRKNACSQKSAQPLKKKRAEEINTSAGKVAEKCRQTGRTGEGQEGKKTSGSKKQSTLDQIQGTEVVHLTGRDSNHGRDSGTAWNGGCNTSEIAEEQWQSPSSQQGSPTDAADRIFWSPGADEVGAEVEVPFSPVKAQRGKNPSATQTTQDGQLNSADTEGQESAQPGKKGGSTRKKPVKNKLSTGVKGKSKVAVKGKDNSMLVLSTDGGKQPLLKKSGMQGEQPNNTPQFTEAGQKVQVVFTSVQSPAMPVSLHGDSPLSPWKRRPPVLLPSSNVPKMAPLTAEKTSQQSQIDKQKTGKNTKAKAKGKQPANNTVRDRRESQTDPAASQEQDIMSAAFQEAAVDQVPDTVSGDKDAMNALNCTSLQKTGGPDGRCSSQQSNSMSLHMQLTPQLKVVGSSGPGPNSGDGSSPALTQLAEQCYPDPLLTMGCNKVMLENSTRSHHKDLQDFGDSSPVVNMHAMLPAVSQEPQLNTTISPADLSLLTFRSEQAIFTNMPLDTVSSLPQTVFNNMPLDTVTSLPDISFTLGSLSTEKETAMQEPPASLKGQKESVKTYKKQPAVDNGQGDISDIVSNIMPSGKDTSTATASSICDIELPVVPDKSCGHTQHRDTPPQGKIAKVSQHVPTSPKLTIKRRRTRRKLVNSPPKGKPTAPEKFSPTPVLIDGKEKLPISRLPSVANRYSYKTVLAGQPVQGTTTGNNCNLLVLANASDLVERLCSPTKVDVNRNNCQPMLHQKQATEVNNTSAEGHPTEGSVNLQAQVLMAENLTDNTATQGVDIAKTKDILEEAMLQITGNFASQSPRENDASACSKNDGILKEKASLQVDSASDSFTLTVEELVAPPKPTPRVRKTATVTKLATTTTSSTSSSLVASNKPVDKNPLLNVAASTKPVESCAPLPVVADSLPVDKSPSMLLTSNIIEMDNLLSMAATNTSGPLSSVTASTMPVESSSLRSETGEDEFVGRCPAGPPIRTSSRHVDSCTDNCTSLPITATTAVSANSMSATNPVCTNSTSMPSMAPVTTEKASQSQCEEQKAKKDTQAKEQAANNTVKDRRESQTDPAASQEQDIISTACQEAAVDQVPDTVSGTCKDATATNVNPTNSVKDVFMGHPITSPSDELVWKNTYDSLEVGDTNVPAQEDCAKVKNGTDDDANSDKKRNGPAASSSHKPGKDSVDAVVTSNPSADNFDALSHTTSLDYSPDSDDNWEDMETSEADVQDNTQCNRDSNPVQKDISGIVTNPSVGSEKKDTRQDKVEHVKRSTNQGSSDIGQEPPSKVRRTLLIGKSSTSAELADVAKLIATDPFGVGPHGDVDFHTIRQKSPELSDSPLLSSSSNSHGSTQLGSVVEKPSVGNSSARQKTSPGSLASMAQKGSMKLKKLRPPTFQLARTTSESTEGDTRSRAQADRPTQLQPSTQQGNGTVQRRDRASSSGSHPANPWVKETEERMSKLEQEVQTFVKDSSQQQMKVRLSTNEELMKMKHIAAGYGVEVALLHGWTILLYKTRKTKIPVQPESQRQR